jgi:AcrR family transcriptional regulator
MSASSRRARQAEQTRDEIVSAARALFGERGYAQTSVKDIAARAGVSVQTVYDSVGSKGELVRRLNDHVDAEAGIAEIARAIPATKDPRALLTIAARITRSLTEHSGDIVRVVSSASATDAALAPVAREGFRRHLDGTRGLAARLDEIGALRGGLAVEDAAGTIAALTDVWLATRLADDYGWSPAQIERWTLDVLERSILDPVQPRTRRTGQHRNASRESG